MGISNFDIVQANQFIGPGIGSSGSSSEEQRDTGAVFYVYNGTALATGAVAGSNGNDGSKLAPFSTIDYAVGQCLANRGDTIYVLPGHAENITAAAGIDADIAGIEIVGIGSGTNRPTLTFTTVVTADIDVDAANITFKNFIFDATSLDNVTMPIDVNAAGCKFIDCEFLLADSGAQAAGMVTSGSDETKFINCIFRGSSDTGCNQAIEFTGTPNGCELIGCTIYGDFANAGVYGTGAMTNFIMVGNSIKNLQSGDHAVEFTGNVTGYADNNLFITDAFATAFDAGTMSLSPRNYWQSLTAGDAAGAVVFAPTDTANNFIGADNNNNAVATTNVVANADGSVLERLEEVQQQLSGTTGVATYPAAAAPANNVSLAEVIRSIYDRQLGDGTNAGTNSLLGKRVSRTTADVISNSAVPIYTVSGKVLVTLLNGEVTTIIGAGATNAKFQFNPTTGTTNDMCANLDIDADEAGALYSITGTAGDAMLRSESGAIRNMSSNGMILNEGQIEFVTNADRTGSIKFELFYIPLTDGATVVAA